MAFSIKHCTAIAALIFALIWSGDSWANMWKMECREFSSANFIGSYVFSFDDDNGSLDVVSKPAGQDNLLVAAGVKKWSLIWASDGRAVFFGTDEDFNGRVKLLSLNFAKPAMFEYLLGGFVEDNSQPSSVTLKECRRRN
jgi:hypothetical protein